MEYINHIQALIKEQKALGAVEEEVVSRYGHLPRLVPEAYNIYTFAPLTEEQLALLERVLNREVPKQYYCCPLNFKTTHFPYPQRPSIGVTDFFWEK